MNHNILSPQLNMAFDLGHFGGEAKKNFLPCHFSTVGAPASSLFKSIFKKMKVALLRQ